MLGLSRSASPITMRKDGLGFRDSTVLPRGSAIFKAIYANLCALLRLNEGRRVKGVGA